MVFNLNEQKVLSGSSGSSVFKGEKDFNNIVVNLPDNIDGHTATELNYVMHFVDPDGGYSTKILNVDSSGKTLKATATVSTSITSKAQAFYAYVLMTDDEETVIGKTNDVIVMIHPVPDEENEIIPPADADKIIKGLEEIVKEATETIEEATEAISSKQDKLTAGENITIDENNVISAEGGGVTSYNDLTDKPILQIQSTNGNTTNITLEDVIKFYPLYEEAATGYIHVDLSKCYKTEGYADRWTPDFDSMLSSAYLNNSVRLYNVNPQGIPQSINAKGNRFVLYQFGVRGDYSSQLIFWIDSVTNESKSAYRICDYNSTTHRYNITDFVELGSGGSQIISGVVNANGTITFTDSDGNTFTTTGSSVIGPQGDDYVLTAQDKSDIADIVLSELPTTQGVLYGN